MAVNTPGAQVWGNQRHVTLRASSRTAYVFELLCPWHLSHFEHVRSNRTPQAYHAGRGQYM